MSEVGNSIRTRVVVRGFLLAAMLFICSTERVSFGQYAPIVLYKFNPPTGFQATHVSMGSQQASNGQVAAEGAPLTAPPEDFTTAHPLLFNEDGSALDLLPTQLGTFTFSRIEGTNGSQQVGLVTGPSTGSMYHAVLWNGSPNSAVDLNPAHLGITSSNAQATDGVHQVGSGGGPAFGMSQFGLLPHALLWSGTAASAVDLNPTGFVSSSASGVFGNQQVGAGGGPATGNNGHALLWKGTAASFIDLNPSGSTFSHANGTNGVQQVGDAYGPVTGNEQHAFLWSGSAASAIDINPADFVTSSATGIFGNVQVGRGEPTDNPNRSHFTIDALVWQGSASSATNLGALLPSNLIESYAYSVDRAGNVYGIAYDDQYQQHAYAVEWVFGKGRLPGDANGDGKVDFSDFNVLVSHFGQKVVGWAFGDFDGDGVVNFNDFNLLASSFGQTLTPAQAAEIVAWGNSLAADPAERATVDAFAARFSAVPEPSGFIVLAALVLLPRWSRR